MRGSPCQAKGVFDEATSVKPLSDGREVVPLLSSIQAVSLALIRKKRECPEASLLYQPGIPESKIKLPKDGKDSFRIIGCLQKTSSLLPSTPYCRHDRPTHKKDDEQDRGNKTTHSIGN